MPGCCPGAPAQRLSWKIPAKSLQLGTLGTLQHCCAAAAFLQLKVCFYCS